MILNLRQGARQCHVQFVDTEMIQFARPGYQVGVDQVVLYLSAQVMQRGWAIKRETPFRLAEVERSLHRFKVRSGDVAPM